MTSFRLRVVTCLISVLFTVSVRAAEPLPELLKDVRRILFVGDSITYAGHYVDLVDATLRTRFPTHRFEVLNVGLGSETASGLSEPNHPFPRPGVHERLDRVLAETKPDLVFACYGMNDGIYYPLDAGRMKAYQEGVGRLADKVKRSGAKLVLLTPPIFDPAPMKKTQPAGRLEYGYNKPYRDYDEVLGAFAGWLIRQRDARGWNVIDVRTPLAAHLAEQRKNNPGYLLAGDGVHPNAAGHRLIAEAVLRGIGIREADLKALDADLLKLVERRQRLLRDAYLAKIGARHPGVPKGPPLAEAQEKARALDAEIRQHLKG